MANADAIQHVHRAQERHAHGARQATDVDGTGDGGAVEHFVVRQAGDGSGALQAVFYRQIEIFTAADEGDRAALLDLCLLYTSDAADD